MAIRDKDKDRGKIGQTRVPEWADDENEEIEGDIRPTREAALEKAFPPQEEEEKEDTMPIVRKDDHLLIRRAEIVFVPTTEEEARRWEGLGSEEEDEDPFAERRRQIKEKGESLLAQIEEEEEEEEEEGEELSVVWPVYVPKIREEDALAKRRRQIGEKNKKQEEALRQKLAMVEAWFIPKRERYTIAECEPLEAEEGALKKAKKRGLGSKDKESHKNMELEANIADVDIDDELNEAKEYVAWKVREIHRIKLDRGVLRGNVEGEEHDEGSDERVG